MERIAMGIRIKGRERGETEKSAPDNAAVSPSGERLLAALDASPRLSDRDATYMDNVVRTAREASIADELPDRH